ncbi:MAG: anti-sigma F factor [Christensenellales bacterium]|jgi:stage II sporulation protein AB (anti-sigma F factor)
MITNQMEITFKALSVNEGFARSCVAAFCVQLNPTLDELTDIKTAVSEAVTNSVVHAYPKKMGDVTIQVFLMDNKRVKINVIDNGIGIKNFEKAMQPFYTSKPNDERSGMGFTVMQTFMDNLTLSKNENGGLIVTMEKEFGKVSLARMSNTSA